MPNDDDLPLQAYWDHLRPRRGQSISIRPPQVEVGRNVLVIGTSRDRILVQIHPNGQLEYGPDYTPDEAAQTFWEAMGQARIGTEERLTLFQHMEAILTRLGIQDMRVEQIRQQEAEATDPSRKAQLRMFAELGMHRLSQIITEAIELGRGMAQQPEIPEIPEHIPAPVRENPNSAYQGAAAFYPDDQKPETD